MTSASSTSFEQLLLSRLRKALTDSGATMLLLALTAAALSPHVAPSRPALHKLPFVKRAMLA